ncbi:MAG: HNH endonuclease [Gemmatimonadota bacterium]
MENNDQDRRAELLAHPFYCNDIRAARGRPKRSMIQIDDGGCFVWQGCLTSKKYPCRGPLVHRLAWAAFFGPIPHEYEIHHICRNKQCINIDHLQCLSIREHRLLGHRPLKLDAEKVLAILSLIVEGVPRREIAARFGIARHYVTDLKNGRAWKSLVQGFWKRQESQDVSDIPSAQDMRRAA